MNKSLDSESKPQRIGDFEILGELGRGGVGVVSEPQQNRRSFLSLWSTFFMLAGLLAGYGMFCIQILLYLFPNKGIRKKWLFVENSNRLRTNEPFHFQAPNGMSIVINRIAENGTADDFIALSSICPHLGCRVHWEAANNRFFCPCHNGAFDNTGNATEGPPKDANQDLARFDLEVRKGMLFIEVPVTQLQT